MNVRILVLGGLLSILCAAGVVQLDGDDPPPALPTTLSPHATPARAARAADSPDVRVAGLMVNSPTRTGDPSSDGTFGVDLAFFGTFERTRLALELTRPEGGVLGIDDDRSRVTRFADDQGTDLARADNPFGPFEMLPRISPDGRHVVFVIPSESLPHERAARISAAGVVALRVASRREAFTAPDVHLAAGSSFSLAGFDFEVESAGKSEWGEGWSLTLAASSDLSPIARWALVLDGAEVELRPSMSMSGMGVWRQTLELEHAVERASFRVECWQDLATVEVPFNVDAGLGLR